MKIRNKWVLIVGIIFVVLIVVGAGIPSLLSIIVQEYEEECLDYDYIPLREELYGCVKYVTCDYALCPCLKEGYINISTGFKLGNCTKYGLVRYT